MNLKKDKGLIVPIVISCIIAVVCGYKMWEVQQLTDVSLEDQYLEYDRVATATTQKLYEKGCKYTVKFNDTMQWAVADLNK